MLKSRMNWKLINQVVEHNKITELSESLSSSPLFAGLLLNRGLDTKEKAEAFLTPDESWIHDPFLLFDMDKVVERITTAIEAGEKIVVYGDYDADGVTSTSVLKETLEMLGAEVDFYIPNRFTDGYGPNVRVFEELIEEGAGLILTCDNGVSGHEAIQKANELGIDVIVTDHHELPETLPEAYGIIHPRHPAGAYPFGDLAGVGVAFKLATALLGEFPVELLDLVAIGTIADLVSLTGENRALVKQGLAVLKSSERIGLSALIKAAGVTQEAVTEETVGFALAPRLNAVGRLGEAKPAVELLTTFDEEEADSLATFINKKNEERQAYVAEITEEAFQMIADLTEEPSVYILARQNWHEGVLGIVASKVVEKTGKPALVLNIDETESYVKGSGRSISSYHLYESINEVRGLTTSFGGHHMAVGITLPMENIELLQEQLNLFWERQNNTSVAGIELSIDEKITLSEITIATIDEIDRLAPFGTGNPKPSFLIEHVSGQDIRKIGSNNAHLKMKAVDKETSLDVIGFQFGPVADEMNKDAEVSLVGKLSVNEWNGNKKPQLMLEDIAVEGLQIFDMRGTHISPTIWQEDACFVFFNKKIQEKQQTNIPAGSQVEFIENLAEASAVTTTKEKIVFVDCPNQTELVTEILRNTQAEKIIACFYSGDDSYLNGMPSRQQFGQLFKFAASHRDVDIRHKLKVLSDYLKIKENNLIFMINVFFEVGFVTIENGIMNFVENAPKSELSEAVVYKNRLEKIEAEKLLVYSHFAELETWLKAQLTNED
ncbi:single-stranded-DNA-specific exonuclease RecJ [Carnobacterium maltaromaticum]|uniref:single-stranded-DNA-specific exonuclease RecJ n=1 Tax=Carnobacterium maltaromaticum TaxID=2751 RepID=UPI000E725C7F|nr:single-stranded-DNA-specific exonuclease RecJ [Carnobacterium maltaromaticum]AOA02230.1 single-stranded-DNA-specific exonuclease RecJ [Carnobacterium maltaromaticum]MCI1820100.1 single-stranded-DNA-specific exonuclease RecJ [Carnobacterium maltaromaticum]